MRYLGAMLRRTLLILFIAAVVAACASAESSGAKSTTPAGGTADQHPAEWYTIGNARNDFQGRQREFDLAASDCQAACKALASLERAANHLCAVSEPEECTDARARVDRAKRAISQQCGGC
jgi:hypothetical protein